MRGGNGGWIWPLHDIVITNIVWWVAYKREIDGGAHIAP